MSKVKACVGAVAIVCAIYYVLMLGAAPRASAADTNATGATPVKDEFTVKRGRQMEYTFKTPAGKAPGHLHGHWTARGKSADIDGATDDTLVKFTLRGPDDKVIEKLDHPTSGNFDVHFTEAGACTFVFDNSGIVRSSGRVVIFDGVYDQD